MAFKSIEKFEHREFRAVLATDGRSFVGVGFDKDGKEVARTDGVRSADEAKDQIKILLLRLSEDFIDMASAIKLFLRAYPQGFYDPFFLADERDYKVRAHEKAQKLLSPQQLSDLIGAGDFASVGAAAKQVLTNLIFPNEAMAFGDFVKAGGLPLQRFAVALRTLVHEPEFDHAFDEIVGLLKPHGAAKWTLVTYWPFIVRPDRHMFMKPEVAQQCAWRLGEDFGYESLPSSTIYRRYVGFSDGLRAGLAELRPRDNIDVQTFMYAVGKRGFVIEAEPARKAWEAKRAATGL